jgi:hypothetical protein
LRVENIVVVQTTNVMESRSGNSTSGTDNPAFSFTGFSSTISSTKSTAPGCTSPGSSIFTETTSPTPSFTVTPTFMIPQTPYTVAVSWGYMSTTQYQESSNLVLQTALTGVSSTTFPALTTAFASGPGDATNNTWVTIGTIVPTVPNPTLTFTYVSGLSSSRWYVDAVQFISGFQLVLQSPQMNSNGVFSFNMTGGTANSSYTIQKSTNLVNWTNVETIYNPSGPVEIILNNGSGKAFYYRAVQSQ